MREVDQFLELIADARPQAIGEDNLLWKKEKKERFQVKLSMTHVLRIRAIPSPKKKTPALLVLCHFADLFIPWEMVYRKGWTMVNRLNICKVGKESANHILIHHDRTSCGLCH